MTNSIFSTYRKGEDRVTASILAVLGSLSLQRSQRIIGALLEESEFELVHFQNQPSKGHQGVPDGEISSNFRILIETKIKRNTVNPKQLKIHLNRFKKSNEKIQILLVLTPDNALPGEIKIINDNRIQWASFTALDQAINELLEDTNEVVSEREAFLLRELQKMFKIDKLIESEKDTLIIPAKKAWPEYKQFFAYICQSERFFQPVKYLGFYTENRIQMFIPKILEVQDSVVMQKDKYSGKIGELVNCLIDNNLRTEGKAYKILILSPPNDPSTIKLDKPIENNLISKAGKTTAFTQNQRYVNVDKLKIVELTSELI